MFFMKYQKSNKSTYNIGYHLIWCPKYRRSVLTTIIANRLKELLFFKVNQINASIERKNGNHARSCTSFCEINSIIITT
jgi:REP element-mobilizing transposase RayT